ncbi:ESX secretion-associated protein EspG [Nocardia albiluteola]|nr:ESX secretion-associated protein EspG [Nocardia albiluteola]
MMAEWRWETDDFAALWLGDARDRLPSPMGYTSRFPTLDEVHYHRQAVHSRYDRDERDQIELAFQTLTTAELRIEIEGQSTTLGNGTPKEYRILGGRTAYHAVMLTQTADPDARDTVEGPIRCRMFRPEQLPARLAAVVPSFPAGQGRPDTFHLQDLRGRPAESYARNTPRDRYDRMYRQPMDGGGTAALLTGSLFHHPAPWHLTRWVDIARDGRYLVQQTREHLTVRPATPNDLTTCFATWIERAQQRLREDQPDTW